MSDPNLDDFYGRVARIERDRALGRGFEAAGTLGRSAHRRMRIRKRPVFRATVFAVSILLGMKAAALSGLGTESYDRRMADLRAGDALDRVTAMVMQADPVTLWMSQHMGWITGRI